MEHDKPWDCVIIGGSLAGSITACFLAHHGFRVRLFDHTTPHHNDPRSLVISAATCHIFKQYGLWSDDLSLQPIRRVSLHQTNLHIDQSRITKLLPACVLAHPDDPNGILGYVVPYARLMAYIHALLNKMAVHQSWGTAMEHHEPIPGGWRLTLRHEGKSEVCNTHLVIAADGAQSFWRQSLGLGLLEDDFQQLAFVFDVETLDSVPADTAYEFFTPEGVLALVPRSDTHFGAIWMQSTHTPVPDSLEGWAVKLNQIVQQQHTNM
ncbi:MAG: NAD(P)/FAD-dependent oxidoreductase, partial [Pseudomonadota bacterium]